MKLRKARKRHQRRRSLWEFKRERQGKDIAAIESGRFNQDQMNWFSGGKATAMKALDPNY